MDTILVIGLFLGISLGALALAHYLAEARRKAFRAVAHQFGLTYYAKDPFTTVQMPFRLFLRGSTRQVTNMLVGRGPAGGEIRAFDYRYTTGSGKSRQTHNRSVVMSATGAAWPHLSVRNEDIGDKIFRMVGVRDHELESEEFNRRFQLDTSDARFATALVDPAMMHLLLTTGLEDTVEVYGPWVLMCWRQVEPGRLPELVARTEAFRARIPAIVWELYPPPPP
jgi:hypothetical protein